MNKLSPKQTFISDPKSADAFQEYMMSPGFRRAVELAFCQFTLDFKETDVLAAPQIAGAKRFIDVLLNFGERRAGLVVPSDGQLTPPD